ncbi:XDD3 family exosortase-dependent surface protein [Spirulina major]|uniref:XDD3 family exosortase-dependent surface protein n=1 Tax=Spirulina major TaxID=270636 RepID=UPI000933D727|nr:XDD3 family exosortase-dependent surface protein [Spirulina major]
MNIKYGSALLIAGLAAASAAIATPQAAQAFTWNYGMDSSADGTGLLFGTTNKYGVGLNSHYEAFGMAYTANEDTVTFAFNANFGINGSSYSRAADGNIGWGDMFLNLDPTKSFTQAKTDGDVLGIRFAGSNDSGIAAGETGVYSNISTMNVTQDNAGWSDYGSYNNYVNKRGSVELIDGMTTAQAQGYLGSHGQSVMSSGTKVGNITVLDKTALTGMGLDFGSQGGQNGAEVLGFSFARSLLPGGELNWIAHVMAECANDTVGMTGDFAAVPPPSTPVGGQPKKETGTPEPGTILGGIVALTSIFKAKQQAKKA